jgi:hypothetical protein
VPVVEMVAAALAVAMALVPTTTAVKRPDILIVSINR